MCQLTYVNLRDEELNKKFLLLLTSIGSSAHRDGWGLISGKGGDFFKCDLPAFYTSDMGNIIKDTSLGDSSPIFGHVRYASPLVPVNLENSHPFVKGKLLFMHNGKLEPVDETQFVTEIEQTTNKTDEKTGEIKTTVSKIKVSDSKMFFEHFVKKWKEGTKPGDEVDASFVKILTEAVADFHGKFAFLFSIVGNDYIVRGKSADLYITYLMSSPKKTAKVIGYAVNTSLELLDRCGVLLSNLQQLEGKGDLTFTTPIPITAESIFKANDLDIESLGEIKETTAPTYYQKNYGAVPATSSFTGQGGTNGTGETDYSISSKFNKVIYEFMVDNVLRVVDIQNLFMAFYNVSLLEVTEEILAHFCTKVLPRIKSLSPKATRKRLKSLTHGYINPAFYIKNDVQYPWMLNDRQNMEFFLKLAREFSTKKDNR
jgi:hypothetical protein